MQTREIPLSEITVPDGNPNQMDGAMHLRLRRSIERFGLVVPLVVREVGKDAYETVGGAQRLSVLRALGYPAAPCVVVEADNSQAALLSQALNRIQGEDDLGLRAELLREVMAKLPEADVLAILPETARSLQALTSMGQEDMAAHLQAWQKAQGARLKHFQAQLTQPQLDVVEQALSLALSQSQVEHDEGNPNQRGMALYLLCKSYLEGRGV